MAKPDSLILRRDYRLQHWTEQAAIVISASLFVAVCARVTLPLPFNPITLTMQNFGIMLVGLTLRSRRGFEVLAYYLEETAFGVSVFNPTRPVGDAQLIVTYGGY